MEKASQNLNLDSMKPYFTRSFQLYLQFIDIKERIIRFFLNKDTFYTTDLHSTALTLNLAFNNRK
jgi:hypothetical protein